MEKVLFIASAMVMAAASSAQEDPLLGIRVEDVSPWTSVPYSPLKLAVTCRDAEHRIDIKVESTDYSDANASESWRKGLRAPAGTTMVEIPLLRRHSSAYVRYSIYVDGEYSKDLSGGSSYGYSSTSKTIVMGRWASDFKEELKKDAEAKKWSSSNSEITEMRPEHAPIMWQSYCGSIGLFMVDTAALSRLTPQQKEALARWVQYGGGVLWLYGAEAREAADELLPCLGEPEQLTGKADPRVKVSRCMTGLAVFSEKERPESLDVDTIRAISGRARRPYEHTSQRVFKDLHRIPVAGYCVVAVLLAIIVGPLNLVILRRKNKALWFYVTAPALALAGMTVLGVYSILSEGLGIKMNEVAILVHNLDTGEGVIVQTRGIYAGIAPREGLAYPVETLAVPVHSSDMLETGSRQLGVEWGAGQKLASGWVRSRENSGLYTVTPVRVRMGLNVVSGPNGVPVVENRFLSNIVQWAVVPGYKRGGIEVGAKSTKAIEPGKSMEATNSLPPTMTDARALLDIWTSGAVVYAETDGLPYLETGGIDGKVLSGRYFYVALKGAHGAE